MPDILVAIPYTSIRCVYHSIAEMRSANFQNFIVILIERRVTLVSAYAKLKSAVYGRILIKFDGLAPESLLPDVPDHALTCKEA